MTYAFSTPVQDQSDGRPSMAFRLSAAILAGAAVLLFFLVGTNAGLGAVLTWVAAAAAAGAAYLLAQVLIAVIMIVVPPVMIIALLARLVAS